MMTTTHPTLGVMARSQSVIEQRNGKNVFRSATAPISPPPLTRPRKITKHNSPPNESSFLCKIPANARATNHEYSQANVASHTTKSVPRCRACRQKIIKEFDPLVNCHGCNRSYHESCLASSYDDQLRCFKCIPRRHKSQILLKKPSYAGLDVMQSKRHSSLKLAWSAAEVPQPPKYPTEVPDTPQHLAEDDKPAMSVDSTELQKEADVLPGVCDSSLLSTEQEETGDRSIPQLVCCICNKTPVLEGGGRKSVKCTRCSNAVKNLASYKLDLTIPETPETLIAPIPSIETDIQLHSLSLPMSTTTSEPGTPSTDQVLDDETPDTEDTNPAVRISVERSYYTDSETRPTPPVDTSRFRLQNTLGDERPRTLEHFIGLALLAVNGRPTTAAEINLWLKDKCPEYSQNNGIMKRSVKSQLLLSKDFVASIRPGLPNRVWTFANDRYRKKYEKLYKRHPTLTASRQSSPNRGSASQSRTNLQTTDIANSPHPEEHRLVDQNEQLGVIPGEPQTTHSAPVSETRHEVDFFKAFPQYTKPHIEIMSEDDIRQRIAEIQRRPSRKRKIGFGDYIRIGSRRALQHDPHDEWGNQEFSAAYLEFGENKSGDVQEQAVEQRMTFKDVFNLPQNPIPIVHEGQLAFRDGKKMNGRVSRSRTVYKMGRIFGSSLRL